MLDPRSGERRDALDQRWGAFLLQCGALPIAVPNLPDLVDSIFDALAPGGVLLTGGGDLASLGGTCPERDHVEHRLITRALAARLPLIGVCRGMQMIQSHFGVPLERVNGHVTQHMAITFEGRSETVNSYHRFGARATRPPLVACAHASDGVVKAVRARAHKILGIMWHPERESPFRAQDIALFKEALGLA